MAAWGSSIFRNVAQVKSALTMLDLTGRSYGLKVALSVIDEFI
jgi:hypothetical protein